MKESAPSSRGAEGQAVPPPRRGATSGEDASLAAARHPSSAASGTPRGTRAIPVPRLWVAIVLYAVSLTVFHLNPLGHNWNFVDIYVYRQGGLAAVHGQPLYVPSFNNYKLPFTYPPVSALLFSGLGLLSDYSSQVFATVCSVLLLPLVLRFALRLPPVSGWLTSSEATRLGVALAAVAVWFEPMWTTLRYGQINVLIAALIVFDLSRSSERRTKGAAIGIAAGLKLTPLIFVLYLAATRRFRAAATAFATFCGTIALSFIVLPHDASQYWTKDVLDSSRPGKVENAANQSLRGVLSRLLHTENVQSPWLLLAVLFGALGLGLAVRAWRTHGDEAAGFALCALTGLLVSPISWTHHWVEAIPALMLVLLRAYRNRATPLLIAALAAAAVGYGQPTWRVPISGFFGGLELHENGGQLVLSSAYVIVALIALAWTLAYQLRAPLPTAIPQPRTVAYARNTGDTAEVTAGIASSKDDARADVSRDDDNARDDATVQLASGGSVTEPA